MWRFIDLSKKLLLKRRMYQEVGWRYQKWPASSLHWIKCKNVYNYYLNGNLLFEGLRFFWIKRKQWSIDHQTYQRYQTVSLVDTNMLGRVNWGEGYFDTFFPFSEVTWMYQKYQSRSSALPDLRVKCNEWCAKYQKYHDTFRLWLIPK